MRVAATSLNPFDYKRRAGSMKGAYPIQLLSYFVSFARCANSRSLLFFLGMGAQVVPRRFREVDAIVVCCFLDVGERQSTVGI